MASKKHWVLFCAFVILAFCLWETECRRASRGSRFGRVRRSSRRIYSSKPYGSIRKSSGLFNSKTFKAALLAGAIYGGARYMRSSYYHRYPDRVPPICTNNYDEAPNGRVYGHFICPRESEPANYTWCCGPQKQEFCCDEYYYGKPSRGKSSSSAFVVIGVVLVIVAVVAVVLCFCKRYRARRMQQGAVFSTRKSQGAPVADHQLTVPLKSHEPQAQPLSDQCPPATYDAAREGYSAPSGSFLPPADPYLPPSNPCPPGPYPPSSSAYPVPPPGFSPYSPSGGTVPVMPCPPTAPPPYSVAPDSSGGGHAYGQGSAYSSQPGYPPYPPQ